MAERRRKVRDRDGQKIDCIDSRTRGKERTTVVVAFPTRIV